MDDVDKIVQIGNRITSGPLSPSVTHKKQTFPSLSQVANNQALRVILIYVFK